MRCRRSFLLALVTLALASQAAAQEPVPIARSFPDSLSCFARPATTGVQGNSVERDSAGASQTPDSPVSDAPAIVLRASASAREVRFASQPRIQVRLCGGILDSVRVVERRNLPDPVQPGVTYRDVYVAVEILGHLNAHCLASRITGQDAASRSGPCASLQARDTSGATRRARP